MMMSVGMMVKTLTLLLLVLLLMFLHQCSGFTTVTPTIHQLKGSSSIVHGTASSRSSQSISSSSSSTRLFGGGFGGGGGSNKKSDKKKSKKGGGGGGSGGSSGSSGSGNALKPKQQWDRYLDLKKETKVRVAVRPTSSSSSSSDSSQSSQTTTDSDSEWLEVGRVKSKQDKYTELAVVRQRAIIAEHAKRLYPLQVSSKKPSIEWSYFSDEDDCWLVPDKSILSDEAVSKIVETEGVGLEKVIGFEGRPDPATGYYVVYDGGRPMTPPQ